MTTTAVTQDFRLRIHQYGTTTPADGTVEYTWSALAAYPSYGGQVIKILKGSYGTSPWNVDVVDAGSEVVSNMADSGRMDLKGRVVEIQENRDAGGWVTLFTGRLSKLIQNQTKHTQFRVVVSDERYMEQRGTLFNAAQTTTLWPSGIRGIFKNFTNGRLGRAVQTDSSGTTRYRIRTTSMQATSEQIFRWIEDDLKDEWDASRDDGLGNFNFVRLNLDGVDYEVIAFSRLSIDDLKDTTDPVQGFKEVDQEHGTVLEMTIATSSALPAPNLSNGEYVTYLYAPGAPPDEVVPMHVGLITGGGTGIKYERDFQGQAWDTLAEIWDELGVRYSQAAIDDLKVSTPTFMDWRVTAPAENPREWLDKNLLHPTMVVPFINQDGEIAPKSVRYPSADSVLDPDFFFDYSQAFVFDSGNMVGPPSWEFSETVSVVRLKYDAYRSILAPSGKLLGEEMPRSEQDRVAAFTADGLEKIELAPQEYESDRVAETGRFVQDFDINGLWRRASNPLQEVADDTVQRIFFEGYTRFIADNVLGRFRDGAIQGTFKSFKFKPDGSGRTPLDDVHAGDFVNLNVGSFPNPGTGDYGGQRVVQVLSKSIGKDSITWEYLDAGPYAQPLATPTLSLALNGTSPRHAVDVTISGVPAGATATVRVGYGSGSDWAFTLVGKGNETFTLKTLPSGTQVRVIAQSYQPSRTASEWSTEQTVTTTAIPAPSGLSATVENQNVKLAWTIGADGYPLQPVYKKAVDSTWINATVQPLPPGSTFYVFSLPDASTSYDVGVRHVDPFGGASPVASATDSTSTAETLEEPRELRFRQARVGGLELPESDLVTGYGFEIVWTNREPKAKVVAEVSTQANFSTVERTVDFEVGMERGYLILDKLDEVDRYVRIRHEREGFDPSAWSSTIIAKPTALIQLKGGDRLAGGYAFLDTFQDLRAQLQVGYGSDPDTDRAYYDIVVNPATDDEAAYPTVDENSDYVTRANMPAVIALEDPDNPGSDLQLETGDIVLLTVRFWNELLGFGQETRDRIYVGADAELGRLTLNGFKEVERDNTDVKYTYTPGPDVDTIRFNVNEVAQPVTSDPWGGGSDTILQVGVDPDEFTVAIPPPGYVTYIQGTPRAADVSTTGPVVEVVLGPLSEEPDTLTSVTVEVNQEDGSARVRVEGRSLVESYRYAYNVAAQSSPPSWPTDAELEADSGGTATGGATRTMIGAISVDEFDLPAGTVGLGEMIRLRATGYINSNGTGTDGASDHGVVVADEAERTKFRVPTLEITTVAEDSPTAGQAQFGVTLHDPDGLADSIQYRTKTDADSAWSGYTLKTGSPSDATEYVEQVAMQKGHEVKVEMLLTYTLGGSQVAVPTVSPGFDFGRVPKLSIVPELDETTDTASATVIGDSDFEQLWIKASTSTYPADPKTGGVNIADVGADGVATPADIGNLVTGLNSGDRVFYSAIGAGPGGKETEIIQVSARYVLEAPSLEQSTVDELTSPDRGQLGVTVLDEAGQADSLHYKLKTGGENWDDTWTLKSGAPANATEYTETVSLVEKQTSGIKFRLTYTLHGRTRYVYSAVDTFDLGKIPDVKVVAVDRTDGKASAVVQGDPDTASIGVAGSTTSEADAITQAEAATPVDERNVTQNDIGDLLTGLSEGQTYWVAAVGYSQTGGGGTQGETVAVEKVYRGGTPGMLDAYVQLDPSAYASAALYPIIHYTVGSDLLASVEWTIEQYDVDNLVTPTSTFDGHVDTSEDGTIEPSILFLDANEDVVTNKYYIVYLQAYDATGGAGGLGNAIGKQVKIVVGEPHKYNVLNKMKSEADGSVYLGDFPVAGNSIAVDTDSDSRPRFNLRYDYNTTDPGTLAEGEFYFKVAP